MSLMAQAYFSKISDPRFGGTYLTLLNTVYNLGSRWPQSLALTFVEPLTWRKCPQKVWFLMPKSISCLKNHFSSNAYVTKSFPQNCEIIVDGFYIETVASMTIAFVWYIWAKKKVLPLQKLNDSSWAIHSPRKTKIVENGISAITAA